MSDYLRWLGRFITARLPRFLKTATLTVLRGLKTPIAEILTGIYGTLFGGLGLIIYGSASKLYPSAIALWGSITLISFFLFTHGLYREEKND